MTCIGSPEAALTHMRDDIVRRLAADDAGDGAVASKDTVDAKNREAAATGDAKLEVDDDGTRGGGGGRPGEAAAAPVPSPMLPAARLTACEAALGIASRDGTPLMQRLVAVEVAVLDAVGSGPLSTRIAAAEKELCLDA